MSILSGLLEERSHQRLHPGVPISEAPSGWWERMMGGETSQAGIHVSPRTAMSFTAFYCGVQIIAGSISSLPLNLYRPKGEGRERLDSDPKHFLVRREPNPEMSAMVWRETCQGHLLTWGNAYNELVHDSSGRLKEIWPIPPNRVTPERATGGRRKGEVVYRVSPGPGRTKKTLLWPEEVLHIPGLGFDGIKGYSPVKMAMEAIGLGLAVEAFGSSFFANSSVLSGVLQHPGPQKLGDDARKAMKAGFEAAHRGVGRAHGVMLLEEGTTWQAIGVPPEQAQFLATRMFQILEICRILNLPPHKLKHLADATFSNVEHQNLEYLSDTLLPWMVRWEQELNRKLLTREEKLRGYYFEHKAAALLRGELKARYEAYKMGREGGWLSADDVRRLENMDPLPDGRGKHYVMPLNFTVVGGDGPRVDERSIMLNLMRASERYQEMLAREGAAPAEPAPEPRAEPAPEARAEAEERSLRARWRLGATFRPLFEREASRLVGRELPAIRKALRQQQSEEDFLAWLGRFYEEHRQRAEQILGPVIQAYMEAVAAEAAEEVGLGEDTSARLARFGADYTSTFARRYARNHRQQIEALLREASSLAEAVEVILQRTEEWGETAARKIAAQETTQAGSGASVLIYAAAGITLLRWQANPGSCPLCRRMHGRTVQTGGFFLEPGDRVEVEDEDVQDLQVQQRVGHPPLHADCDCGVSPG